MGSSRNDDYSVRGLSSAPILHHYLPTWDVFRNVKILQRQLTREVSHILQPLIVDLCELWTHLV